MRIWDYPERERGDSDHDKEYTFGQHPRMFLSEEQFDALVKRFPDGADLEEPMQ